MSLPSHPSKELTRKMNAARNRIADIAEVSPLNVNFLYATGQGWPTPEPPAYLDIEIPNACLPQSIAQKMEDVGFHGRPYETRHGHFLSYLADHVAPEIFEGYVWEDKCS